MTRKHWRTLFIAGGWLGWIALVAHVSASEGWFPAYWDILYAPTTTAIIVLAHAEWLARRSRPKER